MPDGSPTTPESKQPDVSRQEAAKVAGARANTNDSKPEAGKPEDAKPQDPMKELIERLEGARSHISVRDPRLANTIGHLAEQSSTPGRLQDLRFRTRVAYALQDAEKLLRPVALGQPLREELTRLARTAPGLKNDRMQALLQSAATITDSKLVADIRSRALKIGREPHQDTPEIRSEIDVLENRVRLAPQTPAASPGAADPAAMAQTTKPTGAQDQTPTASGPAQGAGQPFGYRQQTTAAQAAAPPPQQAQRAQAQQTITRGAGALVNVLSAMRSPGPAAPPPWDGPQVSLVGQHSRFEQKMQLGRDEQSFRAMEKSGQAALEALQGFAKGPGATVLTRIQDAAKATTSGMQAVLSEMREGGRYAELRQQFNSAMVAEKGFSAAYDRAAAVLAQYGENRGVVDQILSRRPDATALNGRFDRMDAEIGQAAGAIPGRKDGKSALDELAEKAAEIVRKAVETVHAAVSGSPAVTTSQPSPSPSL